MENNATRWMDLILEWDDDCVRRSFYARLSVPNEKSLLDVLREHAEMVGTDLGSCIVAKIDPVHTPKPARRRWWGFWS